MTDSLAPRRSGEHLSDVDIAKILALDKVSISQRKIASLVKCSRDAIQRALAIYVFETFRGRNPRREYKRKTTEREDRYIERALKQNDALPLRDITNILPVKISSTTLRRRRSEAGLGSYIAAEKPGLRDENVIKRLEWAIRYKDWTVEDWKRVIWSDESSICVGVNPRHQWVIRPPGERLNRKYVKKGGKKLTDLLRTEIRIESGSTDNRARALSIQGTHEPQWRLQCQSKRFKRHTCE